MSFGPKEQIELRQALIANGYRPLPLAGKRPVIEKWTRYCMDDVPGDEDVIDWSKTRRTATNTGLACGTIIGLDLDINDTRLAARVRDLALDILGPGLKRQGQPPRWMLVYAAADLDDVPGIATFFITYLPLDCSSDTACRHTTTCPS